MQVNGLDANAKKILAPLLEYQYVVPERQLMKGLSYYGSAARLRKFVADLLAGTRPLRIGAVGGSHIWSSGALTLGLDDWFTIVKDWLVSSTRAEVTSRNGCIPGTTPGYLAPCLEGHVDTNVDLLFIEYTPNVDTTDRMHDRVAGNVFVKDLEKLLQRLLRWPSQPALVLVNAPHAHAPLTTTTANSNSNNAASRSSREGGGSGSGEGAQGSLELPDRFYNTMEDLEGALTTLFGVPSISARPVLHHLRNRLRQLQEQQQQNASRPQDNPGSSPASDALLRLAAAAYGDASLVVHRTLADLAVYLIQTAAIDLQYSPITDEERAFLAKPVPRPMYPEDAPPVTTSCLQSTAFHAAVSSFTGWSWSNVGLHSAPRWGFTSSSPAAKLVIPLGPHMAAHPHAKLSVAIHYLKSHTGGMGMAGLRCVGAGCFCKAHAVDARLDVAVSQGSSAWLTVVPRGPARECDVVVTVLANTTSGGHKFVVTGVGVAVRPAVAVAASAGAATTAAAAAAVNGTRSAAAATAASAIGRRLAEAADDADVVVASNGELSGITSGLFGLSGSLQ